MTVTMFILLIAVCSAVSSLLTEGIKAWCKNANKNYSANLIALIKYTGVVPSIGKVFIKPLISAVCCGVSAYLVSLVGEQTIITFVAILSAVVVYFAVLVLLNTFEDDDILTLPKGKTILKICKRYKIIR